MYNMYVKIKRHQPCISKYISDLIYIWKCMADGVGSK